jgi:hypothetical protein
MRDMAVTPNGRFVYVSGRRSMVNSFEGDLWRCFNDGADSQEAAPIQYLKRTDSIEVSSDGQ